MFNTLFSKLSLTLFGLFIILGILLINIIEDATRNFQAQTTQQLHKELAEHILHEAPIWKDNKINQKAMEHAFHVMMILGPTIELYIINPEGKVLTYAANPQQIKHHQVQITPIIHFLNQTKAFPIFGDDPRSNRKKIFSTAPIKQHDKLVAYLYIIIGGEDYDNIVTLFKSNHILNISIWTAVLSIFFILACALLLFFRLTRPLKKLVTVMQQFRQRDFLNSSESPQVITISNDKEIRQLTDTYHEMAKKIALQFEQVKHNSELRQKLISHVSHDLRTPLSAMQGYLETCMIKKDLSDEQYQTYLKVALKQCEHLRHLVDDLFVLARLDGNDIPLKFESFSICELISDIIQRLKVLLGNRQIHNNYDETLLQLFVNADIGQIERVLINLLSNAIRHTHNNGNITITLKQLKQHISISICDDGNGIPQDEIPLIFEPYYQADNQINEYLQKGSGLGLAISRKIIQLHQSELAVVSQVNKGTCLSFYLEVYCFEY